MVHRASIKAAPKAKAETKILPVKSAAPPTPNTTNKPGAANEAPQTGVDLAARMAEVGAVNGIAAPPTPTHESRDIKNDALAKPLVRTSREGIETDETEDEEHVDVHVPKAFKLIPEHGKLHEYEPGIYSMPKSHADHWFTKAQGVTKKKS